MLVGKSVLGRMPQQWQRFTVSKAEGDGEVGISLGWPKCCPPLTKSSKSAKSETESAEKTFKKLEFILLGAVRNSFLGSRASVSRRK